MERSAALFSFKEALAQLPRGGPLGIELLAAHGITAKRALVQFWEAGHGDA